MTREGKVPKPTLERLANYLIYLNDLQTKDVKTISSKDIEEGTGIHATQFRKDLSYFGEFGRPGVGYSVGTLCDRIAHILRIEKEQPVILVGAGNLGSALVGYPGISQHNFNIVAVFDNNPNKIGRRLWSLKIQNSEDIIEINRSIQAKIAIITVPAPAAQAVCDELIKAGIKGIINFTPFALRAPAGIFIRDVSFVQELTVLSYYLAPEPPLKRE